MGRVGGVSKVCQGMDVRTAMHEVTDRLACV